MPVTHCLVTRYSNLTNLIQVTISVIFLCTIKIYFCFLLASRWVTSITYHRHTRRKIFSAGGPGGYGRVQAAQVLFSKPAPACKSLKPHPTRVPTVAQITFEQRLQDRNIGYCSPTLAASEILPSRQPFSFHAVFHYLSPYGSHHCRTWYSSPFRLLCFVYSQWTSLLRYHATKKHATRRNSRTRTR